ncbi:hypothetical protein IMSAGC011_00146 [Lachnospiraceae bacterium]|nr:hypothetical protein IMSAGC011_00146 [Lachnospiraceae bacterium]
MKNRKNFWGIFFIIMAIVVVIGRLNILPNVSLFSFLSTMLLCWIVVDGIRHRNFYEILFPIAFLCILYNKVLKIEMLTPWTVLAAALFLSIGFSMLFGSKKQYKHAIEFEWDNNHRDSVGKSSEQCSGEYIRCENNFGTAIRYIHSDCFCKAHLENNFGSMTVYFDNVIIQEGSAYVKVENNFGETILYLPKEWRIQNNLDHCFGNINEHGKPIETSSATLHLHGDTSFGNIEIYYI